MTGPYRDGKVHVCAERCATCVFRPGNLMRLNAGRVKGMVDESVKDDAAITCHETLDIWPDARPPAICRGFWDHPKATGSLAIRMAKAMPDVVVYDEATEGS